jgi:hypothetical protein
VDLRFRGPGADSTPRVEIGEVLWGDDIEEFSGSWHTPLGDFEQQTSSDLESSVDEERSVHVGI